MRSFVVLQSFTSKETRSEYVEGLSYTIRPGNRYLNALAEVWAFEGKIQFHHEAQRPQIRGKGWDKEEQFQFLQNANLDLKSKMTALQSTLSNEMEAHSQVRGHLSALADQSDRYINQLEFELQNKTAAYDDLVTLMAPEPEPAPVIDDSFWGKTKAAWRALWQ